MKAVIQRVSEASVCIDGELVGEIGKGFLVLLGVRPGDTKESARFLANKTMNLRVFADAQDRMNLNVEDVGGEILVVSQFTLYADTRKGNRPSFVKAAGPELAESLYEEYVAALRRALGDSRVSTGRFGAMMDVGLINNGPVTIELTTDDREGL
ncbi:MAG: D-tyrosyl-tRNA(Tyr) deacylase [Kiritimatiellae bacterium]|nr:D-tyrosyl-tRNA(Tyr) deacylase [Kiritimatiellia bacterium]